MGGCVTLSHIGLPRMEGPTGAEASPIARQLVVFPDCIIPMCVAHTGSLPTALTSSLLAIEERWFTQEVYAESIVITLAHNGIMSSTPDRPTVGFTFELLEGYRQLHRVCPRLTISGFATAIQHLHKVILLQTN
jgi:hypothetical protein